MTTELFYILHWTDYDRLINILDDGVLYANKYIDKKYIRLSGWEELIYVYTNIMFDDLYNNYEAGISLIFHPKLIYEQSSIFNEGWNVHPDKNSIYININDGFDEITEKIGIIKNKIAMNKNKINMHELLFVGRIILEDHLIAINCVDCNEKQIDTIKEKLKKKKLDNIKILKNNFLPKLSDILDLK